MVGENGSFVGSIAEDSVREKYVADKIFFSSRGVTSDRGVLDSNEQECYIKINMMKNADKKYYVFDKSKSGKVGFVKLADFSDIDCVITEKNTLDPEIAEALMDNSVKVFEV